MKRVAASLAVLFGLVPTAWAAGDGEWFKSLKMPDTGASCCDVSDCHRAESDYRNGQWHVLIEGKWEDVPPGKVLKQSSIYQDAVVCHGPRASTPGVGPVIYCFVPPPMNF